MGLNCDKVIHHHVTSIFKKVFSFAAKAYQIVSEVHYFLDLPCIFWGLPETLSALVARSRPESAIWCQRFLPSSGY